MSDIDNTNFLYSYFLNIQSKKIIGVGTNIPSKHIKLHNSYCCILINSIKQKRVADNSDKILINKLKKELNGKTNYEAIIILSFDKKLCKEFKIIAKNLNIKSLDARDIFSTSKHQYKTNIKKGSLYIFKHLSFKLKTLRKTTQRQIY
jgi:hypothetical protein